MSGVSHLALDAPQFITALCQFPVAFLTPPVECNYVQISWEQFKAGQLLINGVIGMWESRDFQMKDGKVIKVIAFFDTRGFDEFWTRVSPGH